MGEPLIKFPIISTKIPSSLPPEDIFIEKIELTSAENPKQQAAINASKIDISKIQSGRSSSKNSIYSYAELREIATNLDIQIPPTASKDTLVTLIRKKIGL